jgi:hypothetical protein
LAYFSGIGLKTRQLESMPDLMTFLEPDELRDSSPILGGAEGEIPSVYSPLEIRLFLSF